MSERVVFFLDFANIDHAATDRGYHFDYADLLNYIGHDRFLIDAHCYVPIDPRNEHASDRLIETLWASGYVVRAKLGSIKGATYKCDLDIEITMDVLQTVYQVKPDIIVIASGDVDFIPLILEIRKQGIRVEVASLEDAASRELILKCSGFISLDHYYREFQAGRAAEAAPAILDNPQRPAVNEEGAPAEPVRRSTTLPDASELASAIDSE